jgi:hypothetical protein
MRLIYELPVGAVGVVVTVAPGGSSNSEAGGDVE